MDLHVEVPPVSYDELSSIARPVEISKRIVGQVVRVLGVWDKTIVILIHLQYSSPS